MNNLTNEELAEILLDAALKKQKQFDRRTKKQKRIMENNTPDKMKERRKLGNKNKPL